MAGEADIVDFGVSDPLASRRAKAATPTADEALTVLYQHYGKLVRVALLVTGDLPAAEDAVQDAYVSVYLRWWRLRSVDSALAYLRKAVTNNALSVLRHRAVEAGNAGAAGEEHEPSAEHEALARFESSAHAAGLRTLSARQRAAVVLRYYGGLSEAEIAAVMGIREGTAKSHASRGMTALRAELNWLENQPASEQ